MTAIRLASGHTPRSLPHHTAALDALGDATGWVVATLHQWRRRARERAEIAQLDERTLADIGLTRGDAEFLANKPFWRE